MVADSGARRSAEPPSNEPPASGGAPRGPGRSCCAGGPPGCAARGPRPARGGTRHAAAVDLPAPRSFPGDSPAPTCSKRHIRLSAAWRRPAAEQPEEGQPPDPAARGTGKLAGALPGRAQILLAAVRAVERGGPLEGLPAAAHRVTPTPALTPDVPASAAAAAAISAPSSARRSQADRPSPGFRSAR